MCKKKLPTDKTMKNGVSVGSFLCHRKQGLFNFLRTTLCRFPRITRPHKPDLEDPCG